MGYFLNSIIPMELYKSELANPYFVDKSLFLAELFPLVKTCNHHICITRPRRFGKSVNAAMIGAFFSKGADSSCIFDTLKIAEHPQYRQHLNQYNVIFIDFMPFANLSHSYLEFITVKREDSLLYEIGGR